MLAITEHKIHFFIVLLNQQGMEKKMQFCFLLLRIDTARMNQCFENFLQVKMFLQDVVLFLFQLLNQYLLEKKKRRCHIDLLMDLRGMEMKAEEVLLLMYSLSGFGRPQNSIIIFTFFLCDIQINRFFVNISIFILFYLINFMHLSRNQTNIMCVLIVLIEK